MFPRACGFDFALQEYALSRGALMDGLKHVVPRGTAYKKAFLLTFRQKPSPNAKTLLAPCVVAGLCQLKPECIEEFTTIHLSGKEQRKMGRSAYHELNWHGVGGCFTCPQCGRVAEAGDTCFLLFYGVAQLQTTATPYVLAGRAAPRLICRSCMMGMAQSQPVQNTELIGGAGMTADEYLGSTHLPLFLRGGRFSQSQTLMGARSLYVHSVDGYVSNAVEPAFMRELQVAGQARLQEMARGSGARMTTDPRAAKSMIKKKIQSGVCHVCDKPNAMSKCARCKLVSYCSKDCQVRTPKELICSHCFITTMLVVLGVSLTIRCDFFYSVPG